MSRSLPFHRPFITQQEIKAVTRVLKSGWLTRGKETERFEEEFRKYIGSSFAIGLNSGTAALHLSLLAFGIGEGDEVITTPLTFPATVNVIIHCGATPVFVDVRPDNLNINEEKIEEKISPRTKAIIPVHFGGHPCEMEKITKLARQHRLVVIEDAAHAIEAKYKNKKIGTLSNTTCFSFYATKNLTTGEGGMVTTNRKEIAYRIRLLSRHGLSLDVWQRQGKKRSIPWKFIQPGYKYNMFDIQAAIGRVQLRNLEKFWKLRKEYAGIYNEAFRNIEELQLLKEAPEVKHAYHLYVVILKVEKLKVKRQEIIETLRRENINVSVHFPALHCQKYFREKFKFRPSAFPVAEYVGERVISLPFYPQLKKSDLRRVIQKVEKVLRRYRKVVFR
jgi:dTDP-4-amino-4,6-dideoxygalactose transaminase